MSGKNLYQVLEVETNANEEDIKRSYRKLAMKWHPDKNPQDRKQAESQFKIISEAYQVLSDPLLRSNYDSSLYPDKNMEQDGGYSRYSWGGGGMGWNGAMFKSPEDLFHEFFGDFFNRFHPVMNQHQFLQSQMTNFHETFPFSMSSQGSQMGFQGPQLGFQGFQIGSQLGFQGPPIGSQSEIEEKRTEKVVNGKRIITVFKKMVDSQGNIYTTSTSTTLMMDQTDNNTSSSSSHIRKINIE